jgi:hypothetical protein
MSDPSAPAPRRQNRANWIALRTLRQSPKFVGQTAAGDPVFEVRSVRLVLRDDAAHFTRIVACSNCARDVPGPAVLGPADLEDPVLDLICEDCVNRSALPVFETEDAPPQRTDTPAGVALPGNGNVADHADLVAADDAEVEELERRLSVLAELLRAERAEWEASLDERAGVMRSDLTTLAKGVQQLAGGHKQLRAVVAGVVDRMDRAADWGIRLEVLEAGVAQLHAALQQQGRSAGSDVSRTTAGSEESPTPGPAIDDQRLQILERQVEEVVSGLARTVESQRAELEASLGQGLKDGLTKIRAATARSARRMKALEEQAAEHKAEMSELAGVQAALDAGLGDLRSAMAAVRASNKEVADRQAEVEGRLEALAVTQRPVTAGPKRGRRRGGEPPEAPGDVSAVSAGIGDLVREQGQVRARLALIEESAGIAATRAARASAQASALAPLHEDVAALRDQLAAQEDALAALTKTVERLRRSGSTEKPAARRPRSGAKGAHAARVKTERTD